MKSRLMKTIRLWVLVMAGLWAGIGNSCAQQLNNTRGSAFKDNWAIQLQPGFSQFYGDASNHNYFQKLKGEIGLSSDVSARKMIIPAVGVGLYLGYAGLNSLKDRKTDGTKVDLTLTGNYYDAGLFAYVNFNHLFAGYKPDRRFSVYGILGAGWGFWRSALTDGITGITLNSGIKIGNYTYKTNAFVVPAGLGVNWRITDHWAVNVGGTLRTVFNDDVDVWHDGFKYDQVFTTQIGVTYHIRTGWGGNVKKQKTPKKNPCCNEKTEKNLPVIPVYDFDRIAVSTSHPSQPKTASLAEMISKPVSMPKTTVRNYEFRVQILATTKPVKNYTTLQSKYHLPYRVVENHQNGLYRYTVGAFTTYSEALRAARKVKNLGVFDAFVTAYRNGKRVPVTPEMKQ